MKDAIGGTWILGIFIVFIVLFASFLAYSISYTKAFRVKNEIINMIERGEGFTESKYNLDNVRSEDLESDNSVEGKAFAYVRAMGYNYSAAENIDCASPDLNAGIMMKGGYCLKKICPATSNDSEKIYYKVTTFIALSIPIMNITVKLPISGETKALYYDVSTMDCYH